MTTQTPTQVTQTEIFALQKGDSNTFEREVSEIRLTFGELFVNVPGEESQILKDTDAVKLDDPAAVKVYAPVATSFAVTFADNAVMPVFQNATALPEELHHDASVQRGDSGGSDATGSFESRTVPQLAQLAKERNLTVEGSGKGGAKTKADYIKALRA